MEINWSTFVLEIINFLILIWILQHFFYVPIKKIISKREKSIQTKLDDAKKAHDNSESLKNQYENRLLEWNKEKSQAQIKLKSEVEIEKTRLMRELHKTIEEEREKEKILQQHKIENTLHQNERIAIEQGTAFTANLLSKFASPELENKIIDFVIKELKQLPTEKTDSIKANYVKDSKAPEITSAFHLDDHQRLGLKNVLSNLIGTPIQCKFKENTDLLAGLSITLGAWDFQANLQTELKEFSQMRHEVASKNI